MNSNFYKYFLTIFLCICLMGCGFHLRGHEPLPPQLHILYLESNEPYSPLTKQLQQTLQSIGVTLVQNAQDAPVTLQILNDSFNQLTTSVGSSGQVTTYLLTYNVSYQLLDHKGHLIQGAQTVNTTRSYSISSNQILGDTNAESSLQDDMRREVIYQILNHLRTHQTIQALQQI